jgi:hypothetical protein
MGQAGLTQAGRPVKQNVVQGFFPAPGGGNSYLEIFFYLILPDEVRQAARSKIGIERCVLDAGLSGYDASYCLTPSIDYR